MPSTKKHLFRDSPYFDKEKLTIALFGTRYQEADIDYYHEKAYTWSAQGNKKLEWLATLKNWMCEASKDGKLVCKTRSIEPEHKMITEKLTNWQKGEETSPTASPHPQHATQLEIPTDWSEHWEDLQEKARKGISMIIVLPIYEWLLQTGKLNLSKDEKIDVFMRAKFHFMGQLEAECTPQARRKLKIMKQEDWGNDQLLLETVRSKAKIMAARDYLYQSIQLQSQQK